MKRVASILLLLPVFASFIFLSACGATREDRHTAGTTAVVGGIVLFDAQNPLSEWQPLKFPRRGETEYRIASADGQIGIRATGRVSASGLYQWVEVNPLQCPILEWTWRVEKLQPSANLYNKESEDVAASLFLAFGDPGFITAPIPVPTLRYVWTNERVPVETVVNNPYLPDTVRSIVVQSGTHNLGTWVTERRNLLEDFRRAFGDPPKDTIQRIALFTDNDQTEEPVVAYYGWARVICTPEKETVASG